MLLLSVTTTLNCIISLKINKLQTPQKHGMIELEPQIVA